MKDSGTRGLTLGVGTDHLPRPSHALHATFYATQGWSFPLRYPITSPSVPRCEHDTELAFPCRMVQVVKTLRSPSRASRRLVRPLPRSRSRRTAPIRSGVAGGLAGELAGRDRRRTPTGGLLTRQSRAGNPSTHEPRERVGPPPAPACWRVKIHTANATPIRISPGGHRAGTSMAPMAST